MSSTCFYFNDFQAYYNVCWVDSGSTGGGFLYKPYGIDDDPDAIFDVVGLNVGVEFERTSCPMSVYSLFSFSAAISSFPFLLDSYSLYQISHNSLEITSHFFTPPRHGQQYHANDLFL